jgi:hypothetical protein
MSEALHDRIVAALAHQYRIENEIGRGGMAVVYRARDLRLNREIAIKVLPPELAYDPAIRTRFTREAQTSAQLSHAHIVPIFDVGEREGIAFFVMALVTGGNLENLLAREPRQPIEEVRRLLVEIADALAYAHLRGVIHRDIKPDNIMLDGETGRVMVTDFGIARAMEAGSRLTVTGNAVGTPTYMSPEQAMGDREVDGRSDIYSLGVLGYQLLTGRVPFTAGNSMALLLKHVGEAPRPIADLRPEAPKALRDIIERALMKSPEDRWPTASAMREALLSDKSPSAAWRPEPREPVRYTSPRPAGVPRGESRPAAVATPAPKRAPSAMPDVRAEVMPGARTRGPIILEQGHLVGLTLEQRKDLRLWHGRTHLYDRIKAARGYAFSTVVMTVAGFAALAGVEDVPPLILSPIVPMYMWVKLWRRGHSLRDAGLRLRRVFLTPRAKWILPRPPQQPTPPTEQELAKLAPAEILESAHGAAIRRAAEDRSAISQIVANLSKNDRALLPDVAPTAKALLDRVIELAEMLHRLEHSFDPRQVDGLDARISELQKDSTTPEGERRLSLLRRQRATLEELGMRRAELARQIDSAGLALGNLRLDLIKFRSSGLESALSDVSTATQEARALSREISTVLNAAAEVRSL